MPYHCSMQDIFKFQLLARSYTLKIVLFCQLV
jgi:hypothetical protein